MKIRERLTSLFQDVFNRADLTLHDDMTAQDVPEWDSLSHINLIVAIEQEFGIKFSFGELENLKNVGTMLELIERKTT